MKRKTVRAGLELAGALAFVIGSCYFLESSLSGTGWLSPYQRGCTVWVPGCLAYLLALLPSSSERRKLTAIQLIGPLLNAGCMCCFTAGCALSINAADETAALQVAAQVNAWFVSGSVCVVLQSLFEAPGNIRTQPWAVVVSMSSTGCYLSAAVLGGYYSNHLVAGMCFWVVGSILATPIPIAALVGRHHGSPSVDVK